MIWYKFWPNQIKKVEVVKETEKCVWIKNNISGEIEKFLKRSVCGGYFKTLYEALRFGISNLDVKIKQAELNLKAKKKERDNFVKHYAEIYEKFLKEM